MYITITEIVREKQIDLACPIRDKKVAVVSMFSDNIQHQIKEVVKKLQWRGKAAVKKEVYW